MARGIERQLKKVRKRVSAHIKANAERGGIYARGMAGEGYHGGYCDAIDDIGLALNGVRPNRRDFWEIFDD